MASEQSRLDAAVEVAVSAYWEDCANGPGYEDSSTADRGHMRAALLAALPVLLGEPVAWQDPSDAEAVVSAEHVAWYAKNYPYRTTYGGWTPLYAPSLGEGDGR